MRQSAIRYAAIICLLAGCNPPVSAPKSNSFAPRASNPTPADGARGISPDAKLSWTGTQGASYNVYFGRKSPPPFAARQNTTTFDPGPLEWDRTYYWKVEIVDGAEGDIWRFTTFWYGDPNAEEMDVHLQNKDKNSQILL
ncbi:MAG TPA: Ig-like domain-containing protein [Sedimentisphaerales bacterium]|nr:Ig-like domain-containing protein [Sedimentisphaerales bacterium]